MKTNKTSKIIVLALSALLLIACCFGIGVMAEGETVTPKVEILYNNLEYGDNISILYAAKVSGADENAVIRMDFYSKQNGAYALAYSESSYTEEDVTVNEITEKCLIFKSHGIAPKYMPEIVYAQLVVTVDGVEYKSDMSRFSVVEYCYKRLYKDTNTTEEQAELYNHVLGYGTSAQKVLNYNEDDTPAHYFYVNAEGAVVDSVVIGDNTYNYSAGIFKSNATVELNYTGALEDKEYAEWTINYIEANGDITKDVIVGDNTLTVSDKHIVATCEVKVDVTERFDSGSTGALSTVIADGANINVAIADSPAAAYTGDKALKVTQTGSKTANAATTTVPVMSGETGTTYVLNYDFYYTDTSNTGNFMTFTVYDSNKTNTFATTYSYGGYNGADIIRGMFSNGNSNAGYRYLYIGGFNTANEWASMNVVFGKLNGVWYARYYIEDVFIAENILSSSVSQSISDLSYVTFGFYDWDNTIYLDNISFVRTEEEFPATPETAAPSYKGTTGTGVYYNAATNSDFVVDFDVDYGDGNGRANNPCDIGPAVTGGQTAANAVNANGFAYAYRTAESGHSSIQYTTIATTDSSFKTIVEMDIAIAKPTSSYPVVISISTGTLRGDFYIGYSSANGNLFARDTDFTFDTETWYNIRIEVDNASLDTAKGTASATLFVNNVEVGDIVLYDAKASTNNYVTIQLRSNNDGLIVCYDNLFVGHRAVTTTADE